MCVVAAWGSQQKGKFADAIFRPHRMFGLRGPLEFMLHPNDKYNAPRMTAPTQTKRKLGQSLGVAPEPQDDLIRRRQIAGVMNGTLLTGTTPTAAPAPLKVGGY